MTKSTKLLIAAALMAVASEINSTSVPTSTRPIGPRVSIENLSQQLSLINASSSENQGVWVLIPNNMTDGQLSGTEFNLFKLDSGQLFGGSGSSELVRAPLGSLETGSSDEPLDESEPPRDQELARDEHGGRQSRKMKFFPNLMRKPKVSPLYLVNGTVCRFVNAQPICTTLSTTGLFGGNNRLNNLANNNNNNINNNNNNGGIVNGLYQQGQQGQQQLQNQFQNGGLQRQTSPFGQQG